MSRPGGNLEAVLKAVRLDLNPRKQTCGLAKRGHDLWYTR
jgi:hypothetical protein